jgi:hypothetical protein
MYRDAAGVEARSPFFDRRVVELVPTLSSRMRVDAAGTKPFLRRALRGKVPDIVLEQPKNNRFYADLQTAWLQRQVAHVPPERRLLRVDLLADAVSQMRVGLPANPVTAGAAEATVAALGWMAQLTARFGVQLAL